MGVEGFDVGVFYAAYEAGGFSSDFSVCEVDVGDEGFHFFPPHVSPFVVHFGFCLFAEVVALV